MLQQIRDRSQGWIAGIIMGLVSLTFVLWGIHYFQMEGSADNIAAVVDGASITYKDLNRAYQDLVRQQTEKNGGVTLSTTEQKQLREQALTALIKEFARAEQAKKIGFYISPLQVQQLVQSLPAFQVNGKFSMARYQELLSAQSYSSDDFYRMLQQAMLLEQVQQGVSGSAFTTPIEVNHVLSLLGQKRDFNYLIIPYQHYINLKAVTEAELQAYYQQHLAEFQVPEQVNLQYLELSLPQLMATEKAALSESTIAAYYQSNLASYTTPTRWHVAHILVTLPKNATVTQLKMAEKKINTIASQIKKGSSFELLAKQESQDVISANKNGELGWLTSKTADPSMLQALSALKAGEVSAPILTPYGYELLKIIAVQQGHIIPLAQVKDAIANRLSKQQAEQQFASLSDKLANLTFTHPDSLNAAAKELNLPIQTTGLFSQKPIKDNTNIAINPLETNPKVIAAAFSDSVLKQGNNSNVIELSPTSILVLRVQRAIPVRQKPFTEVKEQIMTKLASVAAQTKAQQIASTIVQAIQKGVAKQDALKGQNLTWVTEQNITRDAAMLKPTEMNSQVTSKKQSPDFAAIVEKAFDLAKPTADQSTATYFELSTGDYAVVLLNKVVDADPKSSPANARRFVQKELGASLGELAYQAYTEQAMAQAKIKQYALAAESHPAP